MNSFEIREKLDKGTYHTMRKWHEFKSDPDNCESYDLPTDYYIIIGQDNADDIIKWRNWEKLITEFKFLVLPRKGYPLNLYKNAWYTKEPHIYVNHELDIPEISSTQIREALKKGKEPKGLNPKVLEYIREKGLYIS
jgi:nicotinate-nucleotide adenylyltransferase